MVWNSIYSSSKSPRRQSNMSIRTLMATAAACRVTFHPSRGPSLDLDGIWHTSEQQQLWRYGGVLGKCWTARHDRSMIYHRWSCFLSPRFPFFFVRSTRQRSPGIRCAILCGLTPNRSRNVTVRVVGQFFFFLFNFGLRWTLFCIKDETWLICYWQFFWAHCFAIV